MIWWQNIWLHNYFFSWENKCNLDLLTHLNNKWQKHFFLHYANIPPAVCPLASHYQTAITAIIRTTYSFYMLPFDVLQQEIQIPKAPFNSSNQLLFWHLIFSSSCTKIKYINLKHVGMRTFSYVQIHVSYNTDSVQLDTTFSTTL